MLIHVDFVIPCCFVSLDTFFEFETAVAAPPHYTSQNCSTCGTLIKKSLSERTHQCSHCGTVLDRDHNAALNILAIGLNRVGHTQISTPVESSTSAL